MTIQKGDIIRFLDSVGGGEVIGFKDNNILIVLDEDGFEIPVLARDCVMVDRPEAPVAAKKAKPPRQHKPVQEEIDIVELPHANKLNTFLAFVPENIKKLQETDLDLYLINDCNYFLFVSIAYKVDNEWISLFNETVEPNIKVYLQPIKKTDLNLYENLSIQMIAYKKGKSYQLQETISIYQKMELKRFYKLHTFQENDFFDEQAYLVTLVKDNIAQDHFEISGEEIKKAMFEKQSMDKKPQSKKREAPSIIEVDLHINNLLDSTNGLTTKDILLYQLKKFKEMMDQYINYKGQRIVFIHGKGEGVLRKELIKELKHSYKKCNYQDASFREYGFGATLITIYS